MSFNPELAPDSPAFLYRFETITTRSTEPQEVIVELQEFKTRPAELVVWGRFDEDWVPNPPGLDRAVIRRLLVEAGRLEIGKTRGL